MDEDGYFAADADLDDEGARLRLIEESADESMIANLLRVGVGAGWNCLEFGATNLQTEEVAS